MRNLIACLVLVWISLNWYLQSFQILPMHKLWPYVTKFHKPFKFARRSIVTEIDNVGYPVRCLVSSLNNHKLLQFLQHSRTPLFVIFHFPITSSSMKHSRLSKRRSQTNDDDWQQSLLNVVAMVSFHYEKVVRVL